MRISFPGRGGSAMLGAHLLSTSACRDGNIANVAASTEGLQLPALYHILAPQNREQLLNHPRVLTYDSLARRRVPAGQALV
jgi:hypothetical protein